MKQLERSVRDSAVEAPRVRSLLVFIIVVVLGFLVGLCVLEVAGTA